MCFIIILYPLTHISTITLLFLHLNKFIQGYGKDTSFRNSSLDHQIEGTRPEADLVIYVVSPPILQK